MKKTLLALALLQTLTVYAKDPLPTKITGLKTPESVVQAKDGTIYISEIGAPDVNGDGQISKVDKKGNVTVFAKGLDDPKGLAIIGDKLYVADKARIIEIKKDGTWQVYAAATAFPKPPVFLNDLEADKVGNLFVSDSGDLKSGGSIYKVAKGGAPVTVVVDSKNPDILAPNGLLFEGRNNLLSIDFESGILYRINLTTGATTKVAEGFAGGDGLVKTKAGKIIISSWKSGTIFEVVAGKARVIKEGYKASADIALSYDGTFLLIPDMKAGELDFLEIK
ncbi:MULTISPECIES: SMP-30/gluconolactonase/LRE family protein [Methylotenera]|uniref:SMP-30/gluconolactonase/LRE family protein n=1 Tax=Methylotenera TaxID=359407 RepID=UPI00035DC145|nr:MULTISPECIES: SMP-30/gluconolactonase/LRE family protein [Methylotenera]